MERGTFLNIQNPSVLCRVSKGDQSHFEALGASFVCEGCEVLPKWLCQFFKTHLQLTLGASAFIVFFFWGGGGLKFADTWLNPAHLLKGGWLRIKIWALGSRICSLNRKNPTDIVKTTKMNDEWWMNKKQKEMCSRRNNINNIIVYWLYWLQY